MALQIYFGGSVSGNRDDAGIYAQLIKVLQEYGTVPTADIGDPDVKKKDDTYTDHVKAYKKFMKYFEDSDMMVAEVTQTSMGVGYELGWAMSTEKPTLCLFRASSGRRLSTMIRGAHNGTTFRVQDYNTVEEAETFIRDYLKERKSLSTAGKRY